MLTLGAQQERWILLLRGECQATCPEMIETERTPLETAVASTGRRTYRAKDKVVRRLKTRSVVSPPGATNPMMSKEEMTATKTRTEIHSRGSTAQYGWTMHCSELYRQSTSSYHELSMAYFPVMTKVSFRGSEQTRSRNPSRFPPFKWSFGYLLPIFSSFSFARIRLK